MVKHIVPVIQQHAISTPYKSALADTNIEFGYAELDGFSTRFAMRLRALGCKPEDRVVMLANRRAVLVAAILGVFKAGCVHVPLDPGMPAQQLRYILNDIVPSVVIAEEELADTVCALLPKPARLMFPKELERMATVDEDAVQGDALVRPTALPEFDERATAYCIYTPGAPGRPKGVLISHRALFDCFDGTWPVYDVASGSRCASFSPLHADACTVDMLFALAQGAHLQVHDGALEPDGLFRMLRANEISHFCAWGPMLGLIAQAADFGTAPMPHLKTILTGAGAPDARTVQRWMRKNPGTRVISAYGPPEVTCASVVHVVTGVEPQRAQRHPIGKPLRHVQALLVDGDGETITAAHVPGELLLGGSQVMQGYWHMPQQTAQRLTHVGGVPFFRTGDICAYADDGDLFHVGRKDDAPQGRASMAAEAGAAAPA